jgi:Zn-dependent M28 family amino/carboxypeptidase
MAAVGGEFPWGRFADFTSVGADRFAILLALLHEAGLVDEGGSATVTLAGHRHIFVPAVRLDKKKAVILLAHYDCVAGSPGANDNGAAAFLLIEAARELRRDRVPNWLIIFTDKEELQRGEKLTSQGAFSLAQGMKEAGFKKNPCFIFDTAGRGGTVVISTTAKYLLRDRPDMLWSGASLAMRKAVEDLNYRALDAARRLNLTRISLLPTPFSDDAGFFRAGFPAQTITALPEDEAFRFQLLVRRNPAVINSLIAEQDHAAATDSGDIAYPATWRLINSPRDTVDTLTPESFSMIRKFAQVLCGG